MKIKMKLLSDTIFGNGMSIAGGEDTSVLTDIYGFPYYKGGTFKGVFREELERYLDWSMNSDSKQIDTEINRLLVEAWNDERINQDKLIFSDFELSDNVKYYVLEEIGENKQEVIGAFTGLRTFTRLDDDGIAKQGTLRSCRCVNRGLYFYSEIKCNRDDEKMIKEVLSMIKWVGTMRNRGFGKVKIEAYD